MINFEALFKISYGLYIVCSGDKNKGNGYIANAFFQITAEPPKFSICCNKDNYTSEIIDKYKVFSVSILTQDASSDLIGKFGYKTGRGIDKFAGTKLKYGETGVPIVYSDTIAALECKVVDRIDVGTHIMYIGELLNTEIFDDSKDPLTYAYYREVKKGIAPKNAPTYVDKTKLEKPKLEKTPKKDQGKKYQCPACGYVFDETEEHESFDGLPDDWVCPVCGFEKSEFFEI